MKICITAEGVSLNSPVDTRFGRCQYLHIVDSETLEGTCEENTLRNEQGGVGIQVAQNLVKQGVDAVITGNVGPNAAEVLETAGISIYAADSQTVKQAVADLQQGHLRQIGME